jgi:hypothetical protein
MNSTVDRNVVTLELAENRLNNVLGKMFDGSTDTQSINFAWEPNYLMFLTELSVTIQRALLGSRRCILDTQPS